MTVAQQAPFTMCTFLRNQQLIAQNKLAFSCDRLLFSYSRLDDGLKGASDQAASDCGSCFVTLVCLTGPNAEELLSYFIVEITWARSSLK